LSPEQLIQEPESILVFLNPRPFLDLVPGFAQRVGQLIGLPIPVTNSSILSAQPPGIIQAFVCVNIDFQSMKTELDAAIRESIIPGPTTDLELSQAWQSFLRGELEISIDAGGNIGRAGASLIPPKANGNRQIGSIVIAQDGTLDPAYFYDGVRDFVNDEINLDDWLGLVPIKWPLLDDALDINQALERTANTIYPYKTLLDFKQSRNLSAEIWRQIGNNQKSIYRQRLLKRAGRLADDVPPFEFNDFDR